MDLEQERIAKKWILRKRAKNISDSSIRNEMLKKGYQPYLVDRWLFEGRIKKDWIKYWKIPVGILVIIGLVFGGIYLFSNAGVKVCTTDECFIGLADQCKPVKMGKEEAGSLYELSAENCVFTKHLKEMSAEEPEEMVGLLEGKSMTCEYLEGTFNPDWVETISVGIEECEGELRIALDALIDAL